MPSSPHLTTLTGKFGNVKWASTIKHLMPIVCQSVCGVKFSQHPNLPPSPPSPLHRGLRLSGKEEEKNEEEEEEEEEEEK